MNFQKVNQHLTNVYACTEHLLKHNDHSKLIQKLKLRDLNLMSIYKHYNLYPTLNSLSNWVYQIIDLNSTSIPRGRDILVGFLFNAPDFCVGDKINLVINMLTVSTITIHDLNKVYKPIDGMYYILERTFVYSEITLQRLDGRPINNNSVVCVTIRSDTNELNYVQQYPHFSYYHEFKDGTIFINTSSAAGVTTKEDITRSDVPQLTYAHDYYANVIIRGYRRYKTKCYLLERVKYKDIVGIILGYL